MLIETIITVSTFTNYRIDKLSTDITKSNENLIQLSQEVRSWRDNLRFDIITKYKNELWGDTEKNEKDFFYQKLNIQWVGIEQVHRISILKNDGRRTIFTKFSSASSLIKTDYFVNNEDSFKETKIRKVKWKEVKQLLEQDKYASLFMIEWCGEKKSRTLFLFFYKKIFEILVTSL